MMKQILIDYMKKYSSLSEMDLNNMIENIPIGTYHKGKILFYQGQGPTGKANLLGSGFLLGFTTLNQ